MAKLGDRGGPPRHTRPAGPPRDDGYAPVPAWVGLAVLAAILLWTAGPWIGGGLIALVCLWWLARRRPGGRSTPRRPGS